MRLLRSSLFTLVVPLLFSFGVTSAPAQSLDSVVETMQSTYQKQFDAVNTYIVETNLYTSYNKRIRKNGEPAYKTEIRTNNGSEKTIATTGDPSTVHDVHFGRLKKHASYKGTETINGTQCHVLRLKHVSDLHSNAGQNVQKATYYIDAEQHMPVRTAMIMETPRRGGAQASRDRVVTVTMKNYQTTDGLVLPHRTEIELDLDMPKQKRQQMKQMMENMSERQRKRMQKTMGKEQMRVMKQMTSGEPIVVTVENVLVNEPLPEDVF